MNLIAIGNGFDLNCGLKSSFYDYICQSMSGFNDVEKVCRLIFVNKLDVFFDSIKSATKNNKSCSAWDILFFVFYLEKPDEKYLWCNVEDDIRKSLFENLNNFSWNHVYEQIHSNLILFNESGLLAYFMIARYGFNSTTSEKDFYGILLEELHLFEKNFSKYLNSQISNTNAYSEKCNKLFEKIGGNNTNTKLISFNYTYSPPLVETTYVHGSLHDDNIIIGINLSDKVDYDIRNSFSKDIRRTEIDSNHFIDDTGSHDQAFNVTFYGLSLDKEDYDYLFLVLDFIGFLTLNQSHIIFSYSLYDDKTSKAILDEVKNRAKCLINSYFLKKKFIFSFTYCVEHKIIEFKEIKT